MLTRDLFRLSFHNLLLHKIRSLLTSLGIIFGVGSVIAMLSISEGAKKEALDQIASMGIDKIIVFTKKPSLIGQSENTDQSFLLKYGLTEKDEQHLWTFDNIINITTLRNARKIIRRGTTRLDLKLISTTPDFLNETKCKLVEGRWLSSIDMANKSLVCVVGRNVKRKLFLLGKGSLIGQKIPVENAVFEIVGIIENNSGTQFPDINSPNDMIIIPISTSNAIFSYNGIDRSGGGIFGNLYHIEFDIMLVKVKDTAYIDHTAKRISSYLTKSHKKNKDWEIKVPLELLHQQEQTQNIFTIVMGSIAGISLIVGGIGIMNIMLANVYERRKEIGTRRALGAKKNDILRQFLIETIFLTSQGGIIGIILGIVLSKIVTYYAEWPVVFSLWSIVLSIMISGIVGVVFGTYPAWKAAQQNPIDALRTE